MQWNDGGPEGWIAEDFLGKTSSSTVAGSDLALQSLAVAGTSPYSAGGAISVTSSVRNAGQTASPNYHVAYYASTDTTITSADPFIGSADANPVAAGTSVSQTTSLTLPASLSNGTYYIGAILTASPDANAANNVNYTSTPITVGGASASTINPSSATFGSGVAYGGFSVSTGATTHYAAIPNPDWISITANGSGNGPTTVSYSVSSNSSSSSRTGTISVQIGTATQTFTITQSGVASSGPILSIDQTQFSAGASGSSGHAVLSNTGTDSLNWTATSNAAWINVTGGQGTIGAGQQNSLSFTVQQNSSTAQRVGTISVFAPNTGNGAQTITITQDAQAAVSSPVLSLNTSQFNLGAGAGTYLFSVMNQGSGTLQFTASANASWIGLPYPSGTAEANTTPGVVYQTGVQFAVQQNTSTAPRTATITVTAPGATGSPQSITVTQAGQSTAVAPPFTWANALGTYVDGFALDSSENSYVVGSFSGTVNLGGANLTATGDADIFLAKYNSDGSLVWARRAGSSGPNTTDYGSSAALDASGNIYITGQYFRTVTFGATSVASAGFGDIFIAKYDNAGNFQWVRSAGGANGDYGSSVATDADGNCYVSGSFTGLATFGGTTLSAAGSNQNDLDVFLAKYDANGNLLWVRRGGGTGTEYGGAIAVDPNSNVFLTGTSYSTSATFGGASISNSSTTTGYAMAFLVKYDSVGNVLWAKGSPGTASNGSSQANGVCVDATGSPYVAGMFAGPVSFGGTQLASISTDDSFLAKYDPSGNIVWVRQNGSSQSSGGLYIDAVNGVATDSAGGIYLTGRFMGTGGFGNNNLTSLGDSDVFVTKFDANGNELWAEQAGGAGYDSGVAIKAAANGHVYASGAFNTSAVFGTINLTANGNASFLGRLSTPQYMVTTASAPTSGGTTNGAGTWNQGDTVTVVATANAEYTFSSWSENGVQVYASPIYSFAATANRALVANFAVIPPSVPPPQIVSGATAGGQVNTPFSYQITASNGPTSFGATGLPQGLGIDAASGLISGTPTQVGSYAVSLSATNSGGIGTAPLTLTITAAPPSAPTITSAVTASTQVGQSFSYQITATNTPTGFGASGLPAGLNINGTSGVISGTPTTPGSYQVALSAANGGGTGTATLSLTVAPAPPNAPTIISAVTASAQVGQSFSYQIVATNAPTSFSANGLPAGLSVNGTSGLISGTPTASGTFQVAVSATNAGGTGTTTLNLSVSPSSNSPHPAFFTGEAALSNEVYYLSFPNGNYFGYYSYLTDPHYIYHFDLGYEYVFDAADGHSGVYLYDFKSGSFFYTSPGFPFPYLYDFSLNSVVYYYPDPSNTGRYNTNGYRFFYVFTTGQIITK